MSIVVTPEVRVTDPAFLRRDLGSGATLWGASGPIRVSDPARPCLDMWARALALARSASAPREWSPFRGSRFW